MGVMLEDFSPQLIGRKYAHVAVLRTGVTEFGEAVGSLPSISQRWVPPNMNIRRCAEVV